MHNLFIFENPNSIIEIFDSILNKLFTLLGIDCIPLAIHPYFSIFNPSISCEP